jgi:hypothetical protein
MEYHLMPVAIKGSGGGSVTLDAGAAAADTTLTLPNTTGTAVYSNSSGNVGIGTDTPTGKLDVYAASGTLSSFSARVAGSTGSDIATNYVQAGSTSINNIAYGSGYTYAVSNASLAHTVGTSVASPLVFSTTNIERGRFDTSGNLQFNSGYGSVATAYGCRAWVNFNGTGTIAIRGSGNVSSITDNGVGMYVVNFTTSMPDANYCATVGVQARAGNNDNSNYLFNSISGASVSTVAPTASAYAILCNQYDPAYVMSTVFR